MTSIPFPPHLVFPFYKVGAFFFFFFECGEPHSGSAVPLRNDNYHFYSYSIGQASHKSLEGELKTFSEQLNVIPFPKHPVSVQTQPAVMLVVALLPSRHVSLFIVYFLLLESKLCRGRVCLVLFTALLAALRTLPGIQQALNL